MVRVPSHLQSQEKQMKKTILTFGLISGAISSLLMIATVPFAHRIGLNKGMVIGYTSMVLSFLLVFFGIRSYRDNVGTGQVTFGKAFAVGLSITMISCIFYVVTWEIIYYNFLPNFMNEYAAIVIEKTKASGASEAVVQAKIQEMDKNPFFNAAMTFIEPFPVGLVITLISAAILRKRPPFQPAESSLAASS